MTGRTRQEPPTSTGPLRTGTYLTWQGRRWRVVEELSATWCDHCRVSHHDWWLRGDVRGDRLFLPGCSLAEISEVSR